MAKFTLEEIIKSTKGKAFNCNPSMLFSDVSTDTRDIKKDFLFVALKGEKFDGYDYVEEALERGAQAVIVNRHIEGNIPYILVSDTLKAYQDLANFHRNRFNIPIVAVTGSSGKTTTKEMIATLLEIKYCVHKNEKNYNNEIGLPKTLLALEDSHEVCIVEMGMRGLGQIADLAAIARPTIGVVTNVGTSHIELLGSQDNIAVAKGELIKAISGEGYAILNEDDPYVRRMKSLTKGKVLSYGIEKMSTVRGFNLRYKRDGIKFTCQCYDDVFDVFLPMIGVHNVYDALAAIAVARVLGIRGNKINRAFGNFRGLPMRQEIKVFSDFVLLNDAYNANPSSMKESILALKQLCGNRKIAILGDMLELGDYSEEAHREIGRLVVDEGYDAVFLLGNAVDFIEEGIEKKIPVIYKGDSHHDLAEAYWNYREEGDCILLKGSRGLKLEKVLEELEKLAENP